MIKTRNLKIKIREELTAEILRLKDINWYIDSIFRPFFYEYLEYKPNSDADKLKLKAVLVSLVNEYKINNLFKSDIRLVLKLNGENVGGITLINSGDTPEYIEIAYWVLPEYQRRGICKDAIIKIMSALSNKYNDIKGFKLTILSNNNASLKFADKLGFKEIQREVSTVNENIDSVTYIKYTNQ